MNKVMIVGRGEGLATRRAATGMQTWEVIT